MESDMEKELLILHRGVQKREITRGTGIIQGTETIRIIPKLRKETLVWTGNEIVSTDTLPSSHTSEPQKRQAPSQPRNKR